jgi:outer membrane lipase/esterase
MTVFSLRRAVLGLACASAALLAACGASSVESQLNPTRIIGFGDAFSVVTSGKSYTVNDSTVVTTWLGQLASSYGVTLNTSLVYAQGNARIDSTTDAAGGSNTPIKVQIDNFLASNTLGANDLVVLNGGISDIVADMAASGNTANATQYGKDMGAQVRRLVTAGGKYVAVVGVYNLGRSPWATVLGKTSELELASRAFNVALKVSIADLGANVRYVDAEYYFNLLSGSDYANYGLSNVTGLACASVDSAAGIGTGAGQVNSSLCDTTTLNSAIVANSSGVTYDQYLFADRLYFTPIAQRLFGVQAYSFLHGSSGF